MITLGDVLRANAIKYPDRLCLADRTRRFTFEEVNRRVNRLANGLRAMGCEPGQTVAVFAHNSIEYMELFHACAKLGCRIVTLNVWHRAREVEVLFNHSDAEWLIVGEKAQSSIAELVDTLPLQKGRLIVMGEPALPGAVAWQDVLAAGHEGEPGVSVDPTAPYWMMYTSGTTGNPKGVTRSFLRTALCTWTGIIEFRFDQNDLFLAVSPFFHGVTFLPMMVLNAGGGVYIAERFSVEEVLDAFDNNPITSSFMVPTMLSMLQAEPRFRETSFSSLRVLVTGGAPMPEPLKRSIIEVIGPALYEFYGASESGFLTVLHPEDQLTKPASCGRACFGAEIQIRGDSGEILPPGEVGEIFTRCEGRFDEYYKDPERTREALQDGWFTAGDLGHMDDEGYVYIVGRKSELIISGGENVYPLEIEDVLRSHPAVADCAVIGVPDPLWGEAVKAVVVLRPGHSVEEEELVAFCNQRLAGFKRPKYVAFVEDLPRNASGKVMKSLLKQQEAEKTAEQ